MRTVLGGRLRVPPSWEVATVDDIKSPEPNSCRSGPFGSSISRKYFVEEGVPVIRGSNLRDDLTRFVAEEFVFVSEERTREKYGSCVVEAGDLVFTCWGTIGQVGIIPEDGPYDRYVVSNKQLKLRVDPERVEPLFLFYLLSSPDGVAYINSRAKGTAVPGINLGILKSIEVALPPLQVQRDVVHILSAYDDLIENNNRRMALLEESIHLLYREWFVYLRFPGHERVEVVDGVPEGWTTLKLGTLAEINSETLSPKRAPNDIRYIAIKDVSTGQIDRYTDRPFAEAPSRARRVVRHGDIIWATVRPGNRAYAVIMSPVDNLIVSTGFAVLRPNTVGTSFLYAATTQDEFVNHMKAIAQGAAYPAVKASDFADYDLLTPATALLAEFEETTGPALGAMHTLRQQNRKLREARDLLLPRLMDGRIPV